MDRRVDGWIDVDSEPNTLIHVNVTARLTAQVVRVVVDERQVA